MPATDRLSARLNDHDAARAAGGWLGEKLTRVRRGDVVTG